MREKLKKLLRKTPFWYSVLQMYKYRKDGEYIGLIRGLRDNPNIVNLHVDEVKFEKPVCLIEAGGENDGFFASVRWALDGLYFCDQYGFTPVLKFSDHSLYRDDLIFPTKNAFDYYFDQPADIELRDIEGHSYIQYSSRNRLLAESLNGGVNYCVSERYEEEMSKVMKKYLHFNSETQKKINEAVNSRNISQDVLGVHIRGTDYKNNYKNHPVYISPEEYDPFIREAMDSGKFSKIFLATDDQEILEEFIRKYGKESVMYAEKNCRERGNEGVHTSDCSRFQAGMEVICDMASLSYCGGLISGLSQVGIMARIYKRSRDEMYNYDIKINKGINHGGKVFSVR